jgi:hypothetical protein
MIRLASSLALALGYAGVSAQSPRPGHNRHGNSAPAERCEPSTVLTAPAPFGVGDVEGLGEPYADNMNCTWTLQPDYASATTVRLYIQMAQLIDVYNKVTLY